MPSPEKVCVRVCVCVYESDDVVKDRRFCSVCCSGVVLKFYLAS